MATGQGTPFTAPPARWLSALGRHTGPGSVNGIPVAFEKGLWLLVNTASGGR